MLPHEAWSDFGEKLLGYDEAIARETALTFPVHAIILWRRIEKILRTTPIASRSTRFAEWESRGAFINSKVAARARVGRGNRP
jgi:hypothetical protein